MQYISVEEQKAFSQRYRTAVFLVSAFCVSVLVYMLVAKLITPRRPIPGSESWSFPIYVSVVALGLMVVILRRVLLSQTLMKQVLPHGVDAVLGRLQIMTVICSALAEIVAIAGLVFYLLTGDYQYNWRLGMIGLFLVLYSFPRRGEWEHMIASSAGGQSEPVESERQPT
jgi:hypothetical protein